MVDQVQPYEGPERRAADRFTTALAITVREAGLQPMHATLASLSHLGCSISGVTLTNGEGTVWVRLPGLESQPARRCWRTLGGAGFAFDHPLHPAVARRFTGPSAAEHRTLPEPVLELVHESERPRSRRAQILAGRAEIPRSLMPVRPAREGKATLAGLVRRHTSRVVDQRLEPRFPPPAEAVLGFHAAGTAAPIHDLSPSGVQVGTELSGGIGGAVKVTFAGFDPMDGTIVWVRQGATGVRLPEGALDLFEAA